VKKISLLVGLLVGLVILSGVSAPTASAQLLDGKWLKLKIIAKAYHVAPTTGVYGKETGRGTGYFHFVWNVDHYNIAVWSDPYGVWSNTFNTTADTTHPGENFISHLYMRFAGDVSEDYVDTYHTAFITIKNNKVTYKGTGEITGGKISGNDFYGYFNLNGTSVDPSKLPFNPNP